MNDKYPLALPEGTVLAGQFVIEKVLGEGGFGITYEAKDMSTGERVAVKEFFPDTMATRQNLVVMPFSGERGASFDYGKDRFLEEAQTLAQFLGNDNIVNIRSYFEENGTAYFVMDFVEGTSFDVYIREHGGKLGWEETARILFPIIDALAAVHSKGIVHRDVTPDNIYITTDGIVKLLDFGAARYSLGDKSRSLDVVLKHGFAPKEQYTRRGRQGPYTDVYALGATFYYALTGKRPPDSVERIDEDELVPPTALGVDIPHAAEDAILTALNVQPGDRFQSMEAFRRAMQISQEEAGLGGFPAPSLNTQDPEQTGAIAAGTVAGAAMGAGSAPAGGVISQAAAQPLSSAVSRETVPTGQSSAQILPQTGAQAQMTGTAGVPPLMTGQQQGYYTAQGTGQPVMPQMAPGGYGGQTPQKKSPVGLIIGIVLAILLLSVGCIVAIRILSGTDGEEDDRHSSRSERDRTEDDPTENPGGTEDGGNGSAGAGGADTDPDPDVTAQEKVSYQITVFGANTGEVLPGAGVRIEEYNTGDVVANVSADGSGRVSFEGEAGVDYRFYFSADGYLDAAPLVYYLPGGGDSAELSAALVPQISGDDFIVLLEWDGKLDLDLCAYNEGSETATNYWMPLDSGDKGSGVHFGDHGSDKRFEMIYFHDYSYDEWRDIMVFDHNAVAAGQASSDAWQDKVYVSIYNADGLVCVWAADQTRTEVGWYAGRVGYGTKELEDSYISDPGEYTWIY